MHYVKHFTINGVDTKQVACIELQGRPNAATEGAVGVLGIDMTSPTHEVYKCVAVNGSIYTWELLSAGMSILSATITGEGGKSKVFPYSSLLAPNNYLIKVGDLILDSEGYLYQVSAIGADSCETTFCGTHLDSTSGGKDYELLNDEGKLRLATLNGAVVSEVDLMLPDGETITRDEETGEASVRAIKSITDAPVRFFTGNQAECLSRKNQTTIFPIVADGKSAMRALAATYLRAKPIEGEISDDGSYVTVALDRNCTYLVIYANTQALLWVNSQNVVEYCVPTFGSGGVLDGVQKYYMCYDYTNRKLTRYMDGTSGITQLYFNEKPKFVKLVEWDI